MKKELLFAGIDVDDKSYHLSIVNESGIALISGASCKRESKALAKKIKEHCRGHQVLCGYEATYVGYTLHRSLTGSGLECKVIAPTSIARSPNQTVKNDRIDSMHLAVGLRNGQFSYVHVPDADQEAERQLVRSRQFLVQHIGDFKRYITSQCRLMGLDYKQETESQCYWTAQHRQWLDKRIRDIPSAMQITLSVLISTLENLINQRDSLNNEIAALAILPRYKQKVEALTCFKGIEVCSAMAIATEIIDIRRFPHPKHLVSFMGLDISEYSSGGRQRQFGISKMGNKRLRTVLIEANQSFARSATPSKRKAARRTEKREEFIAIADRCQERLYKRGHRLLAREKNRNKVKVACAREMVGFIWEALNLAA